MKCINCNKVELTGLKKKYCSFRCKNTDVVRRRRNILKIKAIKLLGGKCINCGYDKCSAAFVFHHRDKTQKLFGISKRWNQCDWNKLKKELNKCDLLCQNCHYEIHHPRLRLV